MSETPLTAEVVRSLTLEALSTRPTGQVAELVKAVADLAYERKLVTGLPGQASFVGGGGSWLQVLGGQSAFVTETIQQIMWGLLAQGVIVWGGRGNVDRESYPFYWVTPYGKNAVSAQGAQPYDPEGFMNEFRRKVGTADPIVAGYLEESVRCFNANCFRAAAVLLGAASEKAVLVLDETFATALSDDKKRGDYGAKRSKCRSVSQTYSLLHGQLGKASANIAEHSLRETISSYMPALFHIVRSYRNDAGHPDLGGVSDRDTVFLNLRAFIEYARRVAELTEYFRANPVDF